MVRELIKVMTRECPGCCFTIDQKEIEMHVVNLKCPNCGKHYISEFVISRTETYQAVPRGTA